MHAGAAIYLDENEDDDVLLWAAGAANPAPAAGAGAPGAAAAANPPAPAAGAGAPGAAAAANPAPAAGTGASRAAVAANPAPATGTGAPRAVAAANPAPAAGTGAGVTAAKNATAPLINQGIQGGGPAGMQQARYAAGNAIVTSNGVRGKNPDQTSILAQMNQEVALGIQHLQSFMPTEAERRQNRIKSALASANSRLTAAQAHERDTTAILRQIDRLENQLDDIINAI